MNKVLDKPQIEQKITRIAHEILENTTDIKELYLGGICGNGTLIASKMADILRANSELNVHLFELKLDKEHPLSTPIVSSIPAELLTNAFVVLVDDVVNSGKTMQFALMKVLENNPYTIKTVSLVDRTHRRYPIKCDFVGLTLSTTLKDRVEIEFSENDAFAYLV